MKHSIETKMKGLSRREFLKMSSMTLVGSLVVPDTLMAKVDVASLFETKKIVSPTRKLNLFNVNTQKHLNIEYFENGEYIAEALKEIYLHMGDRRTGEVAKMDLKLIDTLSKIQKELNSSRPFELISGYRSPSSNASMRHHTHGVAKDSFHTHGKAADISIKGASLADIREIAIGMRAGGVGYYPHSKFVHIDVGPIREWRG